MELHEENAFKIRSYNNAYLNIRKLPRELTELNESEISSLPGVGKAITAKITELIETGSLKNIEKLLDITPEGIVQMLGIKGLGAKKIGVIWKDLGVESAGELLYAVNENRLIDLKGFGAKTHLVYRSDLPLRGFDEDVRAHIAVALADRGITLHSGSTIDKVTDDGARKQVSLSSGATLSVDAVMAATGRRPNTAGLGLDEVGVTCGQQGEIIVDAESRTSVPSIFAIGDVTNRINLTPVAIAEGHAFADSEFGGNKRVADHTNVASAVFSQPPIASVGLTETEAKAAFGAITVFTSGFRAMKNTISGRGEKTFMKLIVDRASDRVVG
ncbi:MAG: hypothetical protein EBT93_17315, partial [Alphaproteobacteria bacterium]|nr:hypothetical protein [Alphaproteobacteria bacterium]